MKIDSINRAALDPLPPLCGAATPHFRDSWEGISSISCSSIKRRAAYFFLHLRILARRLQRRVSTWFCFWRKESKQSFVIDHQPGATLNHHRCQLIINGERTRSRIEVENKGEEGFFLVAIESPESDPLLRKMIESAMARFKIDQIRADRFSIALSLTQAGFTCDASVSLNANSEEESRYFYEVLVYAGGELEMMMPQKEIRAYFRIIDCLGKECRAFTERPSPFQPNGSEGDCHEDVSETHLKPVEEIREWRLELREQLRKRRLELTEKVRKTGLRRVAGQPMSLRDFLCVASYVKISPGKEISLDSYPLFSKAKTGELR